uniref:Adhesion G protein-coupled receptor F3 n=1 Tax=Molossus molossus TaxID=27622 RepID=A0A7J8E068_MOLMO|nr:adhesion G protein-coupled receptor F3 [Molossus molossus]
MSSPTGLSIVLACLDTSGMPVSARVTILVKPPTTPGPATVLSSALLNLGTASCCHLSRAP